MCKIGFDVARARREEDGLVWTRAGCVMMGGGCVCGV